MPVMTIPASRCVLTSLRVLARHLSPDWRVFAELVLDPTRPWTFEDFVDLEVRDTFYMSTWACRDYVAAEPTFSLAPTPEEVAFMLIWLRGAIPAGAVPSSNGYVIRHTAAGTPYWSWQGCEHACAC